MKSILTIAVLAVAATVTLASCAPVRNPGVVYTGVSQPYTVVLQPKAAADKLDVKTGNQGCSAGSGLKKGCVRFDKGDFGTINFALFQQPPGAKCTDSGVDWVITSIELSDVGDSDTEKGVFGGDQPAWLVAAFPGVDASDGSIYSETTTTGLTSAAIIDLNNHTGERIVYYQVKATHCETGQTVEIDPMVQNKGK